jgi:hypothetical protein
MAQAVQTVVYNLYATDAYVELADGTAVYNYGFVGGRELAALNYQTSFCTGDGVTRSCSTPTIVNVPGGAPAPTGGPIQPAEAQFAGNAQFALSSMHQCRWVDRLKNWEANPCAE